MKDIEKLIQGRAGAAIFKAAYEGFKAQDKSPIICYAEGWCALSKAGYAPDSQGVWKTEQPDFTMQADITKVDDEKRIVYGWASVIEKDGQVVVDSQGDIIAADDLVKAAHDFITTSRTAKAMHQGDQVGEFVESMVFTHDVQKALGIDLKKVGWFVGFKVNDDETWQGVKSGKYKMLSIGGSGKRIDNAT